MAESGTATPRIDGVGKRFATAAEEGYKKCLGNARSLIDAAKILQSANHHPPACGIAVLALEELGKLNLLGRTVAYPHLMRSFSKMFRRHPIKQLHFILSCLFHTQKTVGPDAVKSILNRTPKLRMTFDEIKQKGFYVDYDGGRFIAPEETINRDLAQAVIDNTESMIANFEKLAQGQNLETLFRQLADPATIKRIEDDPDNVAVWKLLFAREQGAESGPGGTGGTGEGE